MASPYDDPRQQPQDRDQLRADRRHEPAPPGPSAGLPSAQKPAPDQSTQTLPPDLIGDIPPPPVPQPPAGMMGGGGMGMGMGGGMMPRFGPGMPFGGGGMMGGDEGMGAGSLTPEEAAELLRGLAMGLGGRGNEG